MTTEAGQRYEAACRNGATADEWRAIAADLRSQSARHPVAGRVHAVHGHIERAVDAERRPRTWRGATVSGPSEPEPIVATVGLVGAASYVVTVEVSNCASAMAHYLHLSLDPVRGGPPVLLSLEGHDADLLIAALLAWRQERGR